MSTILTAEEGKTISGDEIADILEKSKQTKQPFVKLAKNIMNAKPMQIIIEPGPGVSPIAGRRKRGKNKKPVAFKNKLFMGFLRKLFKLIFLKSLCHLLILIPCLSSSGRTRTSDQPLTQTHLFPNGVDYLIPSFFEKRGGVGRFRQEAEV